MIEKHINHFFFSLNLFSSSSLPIELYKYTEICNIILKSKHKTQA